MPSLQEELNKYTKKKPVAANLEGGYYGKVQPPVQTPGQRGIPILAQTQAGFDREQAAKPVLTLVEQMQESINRYDPQEAKLQKMYDDLMYNATKKSGISAFNPSRRERATYLGTAEKIGTDIQNIQTGRINTAVSLANTGAKESELGLQAKEAVSLEGYRTGQLGIEAGKIGVDTERNRIAGLEQTSVDIARKAEAGYQKGMLRVAESTKPGSLDKMAAEILLGAQEAKNKIIAKEGEPGDQPWWKSGVDNPVRRKIKAIDIEAQASIEQLKSGKGKTVLPSTEETGIVTTKSGRKAKLNKEGKLEYID